MYQHLLSRPRRRWWLALAGVAGVVSVAYLILAMGTPLELLGSDPEGTGSTQGRSVNEESGFALPDEIQTSPAIDPDTPGGTLFDLSGPASGAPPLTASDPQLGGGQAADVGFAIPSNPRTTSHPGALIREGSPPTCFRWCVDE